jgi:hypothetical protein
MTRVLAVVTITLVVEWLVLIGLLLISACLPE